VKRKSVIKKSKPHKFTPNARVRTDIKLWIDGREIGLVYDFPFDTKVFTKYKKADVVALLRSAADYVEAQTPESAFGLIEKLESAKTSKSKAN
jgi:hypothetical protein